MARSPRANNSPFAASSSFVTTSRKYLRVNRSSPTREIQPVDATPVFDSIDLGRRGIAQTDPLLRPVNQCLGTDRLRQSCIV
jgi:hypothetical protein